MAFFCVVMLDMALELSLFDSAYQDMASKFFEHFIMIADAMNEAGNGEGKKIITLVPIVNVTTKIQIFIILALLRRNVQRLVGPISAA